MERPIQLHERHYEFERSDPDRFYYYFSTNHQVEYKVVFNPSPYVFGENKPYAPLLYEFSVLVGFAGTDSYRRDDLIAPTVAAIFLDFYNRNDQNVCFSSVIHPMENNMCANGNLMLGFPNTTGALLENLMPF